MLITHCCCRAAQVQVARKEGLASAQSSVSKDTTDTYPEEDDDLLDDNKALLGAASSKSAVDFVSDARCHTLDVNSICDPGSVLGNMTTCPLEATYYDRVVP